MVPPPPVVVGLWCGALLSSSSGSGSGSGSGSSSSSSIIQCSITKRCKYHGFGGRACQNIVNTMCFGWFHANVAKT